jgi:hypothetical protein
MSKNLVDLKPKWIQPNQWADASPPFYIGISFLCPHCIHEPCPTCGHMRGKRLAVSFWPPIDPQNMLAQPHIAAAKQAWVGLTPHTRVSGETFETLTLAPSIGFDAAGHWHGRIVDGVCQP